MVEDARDVVVHGCGHSPVLLREIGVVYKILADLVLLQTQSVDSGREVHDPPHDQVLITIACRSRWPYLRSIGTPHTWGVIESQFYLQWRSSHHECTAHRCPQSSCVS
jgi:hypothetical protein